MNAIDFVVRESAGGIQRGTISTDVQNQVIVAGAGQEISINARQSDFASQVRNGDQLVITLADGRTITIDNFFNDAGAPNRLFVSADGYLNEVSFVDAGQGNLFAQYGPTAEWGKWSPSDELIFLGNSDIAGVPLAQGEEEVSMLGAALLGGSALLGGGGAAAVAGLGAAAVVAGGLGGGGGGGDGGSGPAAPFVNDDDANVVIGGDDDEEVLIITGGGEPGDTVTVVVGDETVDTVIADDGTFEAVFEGDTFPEDGVYDSVVVVTNPAGEETTLDGPSFEIDTTPPELTFTSGTEGTGDFFNEADFADGVTLTGSGEAGATLDVTISGVTQSTVISDTGSWTLTWPAGSLEGGEYTAEITAVTRDSFGNTQTFTDTLIVDTVTSVTIDTATVGGDGTINGAEHAEGVEFTGTAQAGATVVVTIGNVSQTVTATSGGTWSATFSSNELATGEFTGTVSATATDTFGNSASTQGSFEVDTLVRDFAITSSTGGADGVINAEEAGQPLNISGQTEPGSTVTVELDGTTVNAVVNANGGWTATFPAGSVAAGTYTTTITATATDAAGNVDTATTQVQVDTEAGLLTIDSTPVEGDDVINAAEASDGVVLTGTADPGAVVTVTLEGVSRDVVANASGNWEAFFSSNEVAQGVYTAEITATTTDAAGNSRTATDSVQVDTRVDNLAIDTPVTADNIINAAELADGVRLTGTTEVGSTSVLVTLGNQTVSGVVDAAGNWTADFSASALQGGTFATTASVTATDAAGNQLTTSTVVQVDTEVQSFGFGATTTFDETLNAADVAMGIDLGGQVEAGSSVRVIFDGISFDAVVDAAGNWSLEIPASSIRGGEYTTDLVVEATDHVGNTATIEDTLTIDTLAPNGPIIRSFTEGSDGFRGISIETSMEDGAATDLQSVSQVQANGTISEVSGVQGTNSRGETTFDFDVDVPNGSQLIVSSTDAAGNTSGTYLVLDDETSTNTVDLTNLNLGDFQIENLDLDFAEAASVTIDEASLLALSTSSNTLTIHGSAEDEVIIQGGVAQGTAQGANGETFNVFAVGAEGTLLVDQDIPVTI